MDTEKKGLVFQLEDQELWPQILWTKERQQRESGPILWMMLSRGPWCLQTKAGPNSPAPVA